MDNITRDALRKASAALNIAAGTPKPQPQRKPSIDVGAVFRQLQDGPLQGATADLVEESCRVRGIQFDPSRPNLPWSCIRDKRTPDTVANASQGGFLVATATGGLVDTLRPWSIVAQAGVQEIGGLTGNLLLPRTVGNVSAGFLATETTQESVSNWTLGSINLVPHVATVGMEFSRLLNLQSTQLTQYVSRELTRTLATLIDSCVIAGSGINGIPLGITNTPGVSSISGATMTYQNVLAMKAAVANANAVDQNIAYLATPNVRALLEDRQTFSGGSDSIWDADLIAGKRGFVSTNVPVSTLICGDFSQIILAVWGGFTFGLNPFQPGNFQSGVIQAQISVTVDVGILHPGAISVATGVS